MTWEKPLEPAVGNLAKVVTGIRRCGKTFRLYQEVVDLRVAGISADRICFLNFDDDRLKPYPPDIVWPLALEVFFELYPQSPFRGGVSVFSMKSRMCPVGKTPPVALWILRK